MGERGIQCATVWIYMYVYKFVCNNTIYMEASVYIYIYIVCV